ncbi:MAG: flagellar hook-associated protein FlgK [Deltaproteobacteria bacterium]|nr:flagellar hook-associated protein FlgK [Deltaproteobacteria bacterium]
MTTIQSILSAARSGMNVSQTLAALASRNLANVNTPGYAREVLPIMSEIGGLAVRAGHPYATREALLERALASTVGRFAYHDAQVGHLQLAEQATNDLDDAGLGGALDAFRFALSTASANPSGRSEREGVLAAARAVAGAFSTTRSQLEQGRDATEQQTHAVASRINQLTTQIAQLNARIRAARPGEEANTLNSQRAALVETLSGLVEVDVLPRSDGTIQISTGGRTLVELDSAAHLTVEGGAGSALQVTFVRPGHAPIPASGNVGGELGGLVTVHNDTLMPALAALDQAAHGFMQSFNASHASGVGLDGQSGRSFWSLPEYVAGAAADMQLSTDVSGSPMDIALARDASALPGDNSNVAILDKHLADARAAFRTIGNGITDKLVQAQGGAALERGSVEQLANMLASATGVSIDEEMISLSQAQTALEASSTVVREVQTMIDTVLSLVT